MKKKLVSDWSMNLLIIAAVLAFAYFLINLSGPETDEEIVKCIGENSRLYSRLGCHACEIQEDIFGEDAQHLDIVDCFYEQDACSGITVTPTWVINGQKHEGVQSIKRLQDITGC